MGSLYAFFIAFSMIFFSELGDKTQLLVLSFSSKLKGYLILLGVALGSFLSHGMAILFGSLLGNLENPFLHTIITLVTYFSFLLFGILTLKDVNKTEDVSSLGQKGILHKISHLALGYIFIIAFSIAIGEFGDKTFLASIGLGIGYPHFKLALILGAVLGMVCSDFLAILLGKFLKNKISSHAMNVLSGILFLIFGIFGLARICDRAFLIFFKLHIIPFHCIIEQIQYKER